MDKKIVYIILSSLLLKPNSLLLDEIEVLKKAASSWIAKNKEQWPNPNP